jgi:hypothetical protein
MQDTKPVGSTPVLLTDDDVSVCTFVNVGGFTVHFRATVGAAMPDHATDAGWLPYAPGWGDDRDFATLFRGVPGANRLWAKCFGTPSAVYVSHE